MSYKYYLTFSSGLTNGTIVTSSSAPYEIILLEWIG